MFNVLWSAVITRYPTHPRSTFITHASHIGINTNEWPPHIALHGTMATWHLDHIRVDDAGDHIYRDTRQGMTLIVVND